MLNGELSPPSSPPVRRRVVKVDRLKLDAMLTEAAIRVKARQLRQRADVAERERLANQDSELASELAQAQAVQRAAIDIVTWAQQHFYIPETQQPVILTLFQQAILRYVFTKVGGFYRYTNIVWSQPKKSGKTAIAGLVTRYFAETQAVYGEIYCLANDAEQAKGRIFAAAAKSIELDPEYDRDHRLLRREWRVLDKALYHLPSGSKIVANASEYKSEAGANPSLTAWSELWAYTSEAALRLWEEMTPVLTRPNSLRWVETYAGFEDESLLLNTLMDSALKPEQGGRQMTAGELGMVNGQWPFAETTGPDDLIPIWVNDAASTFLFYDSGPAARRQPWQIGPRAEAYYTEQAVTLREPQFQRFHYNRRVTSVDSAVHIEWWDRSEEDLPELPRDGTAPIVLAMDAAVSNDTFAVVAVSRHPTKGTPERPHVAVRGTWLFSAPKGGTIDYADPREAIRAFVKDRWIVVVTYDPYQLHAEATALQAELGIWFQPFDQNSLRLKSDKQLVDLIKEGRVGHPVDAEARRHIMNANAQQEGSKERLRLVKKAAHLKIDFAVCLSMAAYRCLELAL